MTNSHEMHIQCVLQLLLALHQHHNKQLQQCLLQLPLALHQHHNKQLQLTWSLQLLHQLR